MLAAGPRDIVTFKTSQKENVITMKDSSEHQEWKETKSQDSRDGRIHEKETLKKMLEADISGQHGTGVFPVFGNTHDREGMTKVARRRTRRSQKNECYSIVYWRTT
jgi:hypothetical protein